MQLKTSSKNNLGMFISLIGELIGLAYEWQLSDCLEFVSLPFSSWNEDFLLVQLSLSIPYTDQGSWTVILTKKGLA